MDFAVCSVIALDTYCGETAVFGESGKVTFAFVGMSESVFTFTEVIRGTYTLTFVDSSLGSLGRQVELVRFGS